ncbi:Arm DNA-binding domain-containing protein, partial [Bifidobacterium longum]
MPKKSPIEKYTLKNGETRYQFQLHVGRDPMTGKRKSTRRRGFRTRAQAQVEL